MRGCLAAALVVLLAGPCALSAEGDLDAGFRRPPATCRPAAGWCHAPAFAAALKEAPDEVRMPLERALADAGLSTTPEEIKRMAAWQALSDVRVITPPGMPVRPPRQPYDALAQPLEDFTARLVYLVSGAKAVGGVFTQSKAAHGITIYPPAPGLYLARRKRGETDVYLAVSQVKIDTVCTVTFPRLATPELWDPEDGSIRDAPVYYVDGKSTALHLRLGPYQALFVVLRRPPTAGHVAASPSLRIRSVEPDGSAATGLARVNGRCFVMFAKGRARSAVVKGLPPPLGLTAGWSMATRTPAKRAGVGIVEVRWHRTNTAEEKPAQWADPKFDDTRWDAFVIGKSKAPAATGVAPWQANWLVFEGNSEQRFFRKAFELSEEVDLATVTLTGDNGYELFVNGQRMGADGNWNRAETYDIAKVLRKGRNALAVRNTNAGGIAGLLLESRIRLASGKLLRIVTDATWKMAREAPKGWQAVDFDDSKWGRPEVKGRPPIAPWGEIPGLPAEPDAGQVAWYRFTLPGGAKSVQLPAGLKQARLYVDGTPVGIREGVSDLSGQVQSRPLVAALRTVGFAALDRPILCECAAGAVGVGNWLLVGYLTYSGLADYTVEFDLPPAYAKEHLVLDLGQVGVAAQVTLNGKQLGTRLWRPYTFDVSEVARAGRNSLKITVANTAANASRRVDSAERLAAGLIGPVLIRPLRRVTIRAESRL